MSHWQSQWQRRSSSMRGRPSQDLIRSHGSRVIDRNSRIPLLRSSSAQSAHGGSNPGGLVRSKSTLGSFTPQEKMMSASKFTPQPPTPMLFGNYSSKKKVNLMKEQRNLHDKEFLREAYHMVIEYFRTNEPSILFKDDIRPMSIKMFLEMVNHLMLHIELYHTDSPIEFTPVNYEVEIPHWLKYMEYPGYVSKGWMKTVNAPHSWSNVIALLSWLVSLASSVESFSPEARIKEIAENSQKDLMSVQYTLASLSVFNHDDEDIADVCMDVADTWAHIMGCTDEAIEMLQQENEKLLASLDDPETMQEEEIGAELEQKLSVAVAQYKKGQEDIERMQEVIADLKLQHAKKERNCSTLVEETKQCKLDSEALKQKISTQAMSAAEFVEIKQKCENLTKEISYFAKESDENRQVLNRYEHDITSKLDKIFQCASTFNRQVIQLEQKVPELQGLRARTNPESVDVVEDVEKLVGTLMALKERLAGEYKESYLIKTKLEKNLELLKEKRQEVTVEVNALRDKVLLKKNEIKELELKAAKEENDLKAELCSLEERVQVYEEKEMANKKLSDDIAAKEKEVDLYEKAQKAHEIMAQEQWERIENHGKYFEAEILKMKQQLDSNKALIESEIDNLMKDFQKKHTIK